MDRREKEEARQAYHEREAEKNRRIADNSLDPDNKKTYAHRAEEHRKKAVQIAEKPVANSGKSGIIKANKPLKINIQLFARPSKEFPTVFLPKKEYAHVMSELETHITLEQRRKKVFRKAIGDYIYTVENNGAGNYRIIGKRKIEE